jgi:cytochrome P450 / NADPH-cytochrome P450 reductase
MVETAVPQPPVKPFIGNLGVIEPGAGIQSLMALAKTYGPFFKLRLINSEIYLATSQAIVDELCDETRFEKRVHDFLERLRSFAGDGLFTAYNDEPNWAKAHRLLMPAFGPIAIRGMFDKMLDIADQMLVRWDRFGPSAVIDVTDNMTRLTLDTIALCAFGTRFNSFYQDELHPFVGAMVRALKESGKRGRRPDIVNAFMLSRARQFELDQRLMREVAQDLIRQRRADPDAAEKSDLLNIMLNGADPVTHEKLSDENIGHQLVTFLIAGHETTSGLLSFAIYLLLKNPGVLRKARAEVDEVLGAEMPGEEHLGRLRYIEQVLMESLRLWPTAPVFGVTPRAETLLAGKYRLTPDDTILVLIPSLHRDPAVWGDDVEAFRPARFAPELAEKLPPNAWKPFGNGSRACIGRPFAMLEAQLVLSMILQRFDLVLDDPNYQLKISETLTLKPAGLHIRAKARHHGGLLSRASRVATPRRQKPVGSARVAAPSGPRTPLMILFGSNAGSCEAFANRIANDATGNGFDANVAPLDGAVEQLPHQGALIVVTASYEGQPPDNARQFVPYLEALGPGDLKGLRFAVFGCGDRQWARTYQAIPKRVDAALENAGATRLLPRGESDSGGDFFGTFDEWYAKLWPALAEAFEKQPVPPTGEDELQVELVTAGRENVLQLEEHQQGRIVKNIELVDMTKPRARSKRHLEIELPAGTIYRSGDYLEVLARNPKELVDRALRRFALAWDTQIVVRRGTPGATHLPLDNPVGARDLLSSYAELHQPATRSQMQTLMEAAPSPHERGELDVLAGEAYEREVLGKRMSLLDVLERFPSTDLPIARFLASLPPMRVR